MSAQKQSPNNDGATKRRLIEVGIQLFGVHGFEATSTRALATAANANLNSILYHFGGKEGLYRAVLEHVVDIKLREIESQTSKILDVCTNPTADRETLIMALRSLVRTMVNVLIGGEESKGFSQIMMQEQISPTAAFDFLYETFFVRVHTAWAMLLARLTDMSDGIELQLRTWSLMGQFLVFRVSMTSLLRRLGCEQLSDEHVECIVTFGCQQVEAIIDAFKPVSPHMNQAQGSEASK